VSPVNLPLLARERAQAQVGHGCRARANRRHEVPEVVGAAAVGALMDDGEQPRRAQRRQRGAVGAYQLVAGTALLWSPTLSGASGGAAGQP
jgi:hypothetical protein